MAKIEHKSNQLNIPVPDHVITDVRDYLDGMKKRGKSIANRGDFDGTGEDQITGLIGESVVKHHHTGSYIDFEKRLEEDNGADGGVDYTAYGVNYDVKSSRRSRLINPNGVGTNGKSLDGDWDWSFLISDLQMGDYYESDILVFCYYAPKKAGRWSPPVDTVQILGYYPKPLIKLNSRWKPKGSIVFNNYGQPIELKSDCYQFDVKHMMDFRELVPGDDATKYSCSKCGDRLYEAEVSTGGDQSTTGYACDTCEESFQIDFNEDLY